MSGSYRDAGAQQRPGPGRIAAYAGLLVLGAVVGVAGAAVQGGFFPGGLVLALLATAAVFLGGQRATGSQLGLGAAVAGWLVSVILLTMGRPEGDGAFAAGLGPLVYLLGGMVIAVICATVSRPAVSAARPGSRSR
ncbi:DUF6113 family protein [Streptomyces fuscigenes]|uniref:DUF6113 family protein n=1 Tax=Streptomyces fuscigenes TaxID=1528880 RepID=UPI001F3B9A38|nr:DUF6113 family protein [Streptomyces fuscigenes]MCF3963932.1 DUF6113 family protein [Streptomyces fuscigenes]